MMMMLMMMMMINDLNTKSNTNVPLQLTIDYWTNTHKRTNKPTNHHHHHNSGSGGKQEVNADQFVCMGILLWTICLCFETVLPISPSVACVRQVVWHGSTRNERWIVVCARVQILLHIFVFVLFMCVCGLVFVWPGSCLDDLCLISVRVYVFWSFIVYYAHSHCTGWSCPWPISPLGHCCRIYSVCVCDHHCAVACSALHFSITMMMASSFI